MSAPRSMQNLPRAGRWAIYIALAIVFAIACAFLSHWQFSRNADRSAELALVDANYDADPVPLSELIPAGEDLDPGDEWHPVVLTGEYLSDDQLLVRNRPRGGTAAFEVLVPFRLDDGRVIVVDRGWVPPGESQPVPDHVPAAPDGHVTVVARLQAGESLPSSGRSAPDGQVPTINLPLIADTLPGDDGDVMIQSAYGLMVSEDPAPSETPPSPIPDPSADPGPYLSYAIQWILFAIMGFVFIGYIIRTERQLRREDAEDDELEKADADAGLGDSTGAADTESPHPSVEQVRTARRPRRRRDRDADDEDAILDSSLR